MTQSSPLLAITLPVLRCPKCDNAEPTMRCRFCGTDTLAALCAKVAQDIAGDRPPLLKA